MLVVGVGIVTSSSRQHFRFLVELIQNKSLMRLFEVTFSKVINMIVLKYQSSKLN